MHVCFLLLAFHLALQVLPVLTQTVCSGTLTGSFVDISVNGGTCTLEAVTLTGSITVTSGGTLLITGASQVLGGLSADGAGDVQIAGTSSVLGSVTFFNSLQSTITIASGASASSVSLQSSGNAVVSGTVESVSTLLSKQVSVLDGQIGGGGILVQQGTADIILCGADIGGAITVTLTTGGVTALQSATCSASTITGSVGVSKGTGDVILTGATLSAGDLIVAEQNGAVSVAGGTLGDVLVSGTTGPVTLNDITTESDMIISAVPGKVSVIDSTIVGDTTIALGGEVAVTGSSFSLEDVSIKSNDGPITFNGNTDVSVSFVENDDVQIADNIIVSASVTKNTGGVSITGNTFEKLSCSDNAPAPTGFGNTVTVLADGQCSSF